MSEHINRCGHGFGEKPQQFNDGNNTVGLTNAKT